MHSVETHQLTKEASAMTAPNTHFNPYGDENGGIWTSYTTWVPNRVPSNGSIPSNDRAPSNDVADLASVVYSAGTIFNDLSTSRHGTVNFLRSGSLDGITSRSDLALLQDLRDLAQYIIDNHEAPIDHEYVQEVNATITRSGPLHPGQYRTDAQQIGVNTQHGRHEPKPLHDAGLQQIVDTAMAEPDSREQALELFVLIAKAQPFEDGNKRTALFVANSVLIRGPEPEMLVVPVSETSASEAARFNDLLARAYVLDEHDGIKDLLRAEGFSEHDGPELG